MQVEVPLSLESRISGGVAFQVKGFYLRAPHSKFQVQRFW